MLVENRMERTMGGNNSMDMLSFWILLVVWWKLALVENV